ncbi:MAG: hypothetical protein JJ975_01505 [Bacteroidia bacterium]|nr:hypothetical protein [Bacteroidia bacterium]
MMQRKMSTKGMILDICSQRSRAQKFVNLDKSYRDILNCLLQEDYYRNEDQALPTIKNICLSVNKSYDVVRKQIKNIHDDLASYPMAEEFPFNTAEVSYVFYVKGFGESINLNYDHLHVVPRKGEIVQLPFFKEFLGTTYFHVSEIQHDFQDNKQCIVIWLLPGAYNSYWEMRKHQAKELGEISLLESFKDDAEIKEKLKLSRSRPW